MFWNAATVDWKYISHLIAFYFIGRYIVWLHVIYQNYKSNMENNIADHSASVSGSRQVDPLKKKIKLCGFRTSQTQVAVCQLSYCRAFGLKMRVVAVCVHNALICIHRTNIYLSSLKFRHRSVTDVSPRAGTPIIILVMTQISVMHGRHKTQHTNAFQ